MPYIITTKQEHLDGWKPLSRHAVVTLEERFVFDSSEWRRTGFDKPDGNECHWHSALLLSRKGHGKDETATVLFLYDGRISGGHFTSAMRDRSPTLPEAGGTVGPLPDGTVIEVSKFAN